MPELLLNIDVPDLEPAVSFYCNALGLRVGRRFDGAAELLGSTAPIYLLAKPAGTPVSSSTEEKRRYERHWTPVHPDFVVADLEQALGRAQAAGAVVEIGIREASWGRIANLCDPFGNGFCLLQFTGRGYDEIKL
jgi:predicted enzyme related to lactoylglutathione lyase